MIDYDLMEQLKELALAGVNVNVNVDLVVFEDYIEEDDEDPGLPPVEEPKDPPAEDPGTPPAKPATKFFRVTAEKVLAHEAKGFNQAGYPVMEIYNTGNVSQRIRFDAGALVEVLPTPVRADGSISFYQIWGTVGEKGQALYLEAARGTLL